MVNVYTKRTMNSTQTLSVSDLRQKTKSVLKTVASKQQSFVILQRSKPKAVLVDVEYFKALEEMLLDCTDSKEAEKAKKEAKDPLDKYIKRRWG